MSLADALTWDRVDNPPLVDTVAMVLPLASTSQAEAQRLMAEMPLIVEFATSLRRFDPGVQSVEVSIVEMASIEGSRWAQHIATTCPYGLNVLVRYPDYMSRVDALRRQRWILQALVSM
jgi:hypothetical protein